MLTAYNDCHNVREDGIGPERSLDFKASKPLNGTEFALLMTEAIGGSDGGYNEFTTDTIKKLVDYFGLESEYTIARESSVCVYIKPKDKSKNIPFWPLRVDEVSYDVKSKTFRLWWD